MTIKEITKSGTDLLNALIPIYKKYVWKDQTIEAKVNVKEEEDGIDQWVHLSFPPYVEVNLTVNRFYTKTENGLYYLDSTKIMLGWGDDYHKLDLAIDYPIVSDSNGLLIEQIKILLATMEKLHKKNRKYKEKR